MNKAMWILSFLLIEQSASNDMNKENVRILRESHSHLGVTGCSTKCYGNAGIKSRFTVFECKCFDKNAVAGSVRFSSQYSRGSARDWVKFEGELNGLASARELRTLDARVCARARGFTQLV